MIGNEEKRILQKLKSAVTRASWENDDVDQDGVLLCGWMYRSTGHRGRKRRVPGTNRRRGFAKQKKWTVTMTSVLRTTSTCTVSWGPRRCRSVIACVASPCRLVKSQNQRPLQISRVWGLGIYFTDDRHTNGFSLLPAKYPGDDEKSSNLVEGSCLTKP